MEMLKDRQRHYSKRHRHRGLSDDIIDPVVEEAKCAKGTTSNTLGGKSVEKYIMDPNCWLVFALICVLLSF